MNTIVNYLNQYNNHIIIFSFFTYICFLIFILCYSQKFLSFSLYIYILLLLVLPACILTKPKDYYEPEMTNKNLKSIYLLILFVGCLGLNTNTDILIRYTDALTFSISLFLIIVHISKSYLTDFEQYHIDHLPNRYILHYLNILNPVDFIYLYPNDLLNSATTSETLIINSTYLPKWLGNFHRFYAYCILCFSVVEIYSLSYYKNYIVVVDIISNIVLSIVLLCFPKNYLYTSYKSTLLIHSPYFYYLLKSFIILCIYLSYGYFVKFNVIYNILFLDVIDIIIIIMNSIVFAFIGILFISLILYVFVMMPILLLYKCLKDMLCSYS